MGTRYLFVIGLWAIAASAVAADVQFESGKFAPSDPVVRVSGQLFRPDGPGPHPAVVLLHTCGGLKQHVTHDWPQLLSGLGYVVLAVDTLGSRGYHKGCSTMQNRFLIQARDAYGALDYLSAQSFVNPNKIATIGFSMGAFAINEVIMARAPRPSGSAEFRAFVSLYGRCREMQTTAIKNVPLLQIIAERDEKLAPSCIAAGKSIRMEVHVLPGVHHAFDQPDITQLRPDAAGNMMLYDPAATEKVRGLVRDFLTRNLI